MTPDDTTGMFLDALNAAISEELDGAFGADQCDFTMLVWPRGGAPIAEIHLLGRGNRDDALVAIKRIIDERGLAQLVSENGRPVDPKPDA